MRRINAVIIFVIVVFYSAFSQKKPVVTLDENNGLCDNIVREIIKDKNGCLWIGTDNGLSRYNGNHFVNYHQYDGLAGNMVWGLAADSVNHIYAGCYTGGLSLIVNGTVRRSWYFKAKKNNTIRKLLFDDTSGSLIVGTDYGLYLFKDTVFHRIRFPYPPGTAKSSVISLKKHKKRIFFTLHGYQGGVYELHIDPAVPGNSEAVRTGPERSMFGLTFYHDTVFSNRFNKLYYYSLNGGRSGLYASAKNNFLAWDMVTLPHGWIIAGGYKITDYALNTQLLDVKKKSFYDAPWLLQSNTVFCFYYDTLRKIVWAGTENGMKALMNTPFSYYDTYPGNIIDLVYVHDTLFILSDNAIYILDNGKVKKWLSKNTIDRRIGTAMETYFKHNKAYAHSLFSAHAVNYRYFVEDNGRVFLNTNKGSVTIPDFSVYLPFAMGHFVTDGREGYFVRDYWKMVYYPDVGNIFHSIDTIGARVGGIKDIWDIKKSGDVFYFMSCFNGIYALSHHKVWQLNEDNSGIDNYLVGMDLGPEGNIWTISANGNLFEVVFKDSLILKKKINRFNSIIEGEDYKWLKFNDGYLYLATNRGLNILRSDEVIAGKIKTLWFYNRYNGYLDKATANPAVAGRGYLFVHSPGKLLRIGKPVGKSGLGKLTIGNVQVDGKKYNYRIFNGTILSSQTRNIRIPFYLLKYPTDRNVTYRYRINGGKWNPSDLIDLQYPKPGQYDIEMEAINTERNETYHASVGFIIKRPYWGQWWFYLILGLALPLLVYIILKYRYESIRKREEEKNRFIRENADLQIRALQLQMNPHFIFNSLNAVQGAILTRDTDNALTFIGNLSSIIRKNLENVSKEYIPLSEEISFLKEYAELEKYRLGGKVQFEFDIEVEDLDLLIPPMLIQPVVENSIKHGLHHKKEGGTIKIQVRNTGRALLFVVEDNGVGRVRAAELEKSKGHNSKGVALIKERLNYLNQKNNTDIYRIVYTDLYHDDGSPAGTRVEVRFLIIKDTGQG